MFSRRGGAGLGKDMPPVEVDYDSTWGDAAKPQVASELRETIDVISLDQSLTKTDVKNLVPSYAHVMCVNVLQLVSGGKTTRRNGDTQRLAMRCVVGTIRHCSGR